MARILNLPAKHQEIGRIRSGKKTDNPKRPMEALEDWRFTSKSELAIKAIAGIYGGQPQRWSEREDEWEVFTESHMLKVSLPGDPIFTAYEKWGQGGNQRRCDGELCVIPVEDPQGGHLQEVPCQCEKEGIEPGLDKKACTVTVRLKLVLPDIPGMGIWMLTSGSIYAAMELPAVCDLIDGLRQRSGILIPCRLELEYREEKRAYEKFTRKYHVPTLHVDDSVERITRQIDNIGSAQSIAPAARRELAPPTGTPAPAGGAGLPPGPGGPPPGSERPDLATSRSYGKTELQELCRANNLDDDGIMPMLIARLKEAGVTL